MDRGFKAIIMTVIGGVIASAVLNQMAPLLPTWVSLLFVIAFVLGDAALVLSMTKWGVGFAAGWLLGAVLFLDSGLLSGWTILVYLVAPTAGLLARASRTARL